MNFRDPFGESALILLSGGQDSATCLAMAQAQFKTLRAIGFQYGQRHSVEIESARELAKLVDVSFSVFDLSTISEMTENALMSELPISCEEGALPNTFVDGRNLMFLLYAAIYAKRFGIHDLITGVCQTDYSGYPDCRQPFIDSAEQTLSLAMDYKFRIHTPLMYLTKAETVKKMVEMGRLDWYSKTHTCYLGQYPPCGTCPACVLRAKGFELAEVRDPLLS